ncbi:circularly permutated Ras protein 1 [Aplysia californica]|uniref:Circularly permutated Ras protein 1 n=1 Tax=Aplysia californica TaxID=6500 RepID=A0ABM1W042_APLCA|nr:circularly permutated Ras protein 1 [Aplysia californica]
MDFSSKYILDESGVEEEAEDECEDVLDDFDPEAEGFGGYECAIMDEVEEEDQQPPAGKPSKSLNTNKMSLSLCKLVDEPAEQAVDVSELITCSNPNSCGAVLSYIDQLEDIPDDDTAKFWTCKFCGLKQRIAKMSPLERQDVIYCERPCEPLDNTVVGPQTTVFVMDISGSMSKSMTINPATISPSLKDLASTEQRELFAALCPEMVGQQLPGVTEVTRLQVVKDAVMEGLKKMNPCDRAGLVVFNNEVTIYGDGTAPPTVVSGGQLFDRKELLRISGELTSLSPLTNEAKQRLLGIVNSLKEGGETAVGPALYLGVALASQAKVAKVVLCTDGLANVGLGTLENVTSEQETDAKEFYERVITECQHSGVSVQLLSFSDCTVGVETQLGAVPVETGGMILKSTDREPDLSQILGSVLTNEIIATRADARLVVHQKMFAKLPGAGEEDLESSVSHMMGNISRCKKQCYAFGVKPEAGQDAPVPSSDEVPQPTEYPFQFQINFTSMEGRVVTRVWTEKKPVTTSRTEAEQNCDVSAQTDNFLLGSATELLSTPGPQLLRKAKQIVSECESLQQRQGHGQVREMLSKFRQCVTKIAQLQKIDEDSALFLRSLQTGA